MLSGVVPVHLKCTQNWLSEMLPWVCSFSETHSSCNVVSPTSQAFSALCQETIKSIFMYHLMQLSVTGLLLWPIKGANRPPCHYCRRVMWRFPDVNMGVSMSAWWKFSSSDRRGGLMFKLLLPWEQTFVLGSSHTVLSPPVTVEKLCEKKNKINAISQKRQRRTHSHASGHTHAQICIRHDIYRHVMPWASILFGWSALWLVSKNAAERKYWFRNKGGEASLCLNCKCQGTFYDSICNMRTRVSISLLPAAVHLIPHHAERELGWMWFLMKE